MPLAQAPYKEEKPVRQLVSDDEARQTARILQQRDDLPKDVREGMMQSLRAYGLPKQQGNAMQGTDPSKSPVEAVIEQANKGSGGAEVGAKFLQGHVDIAAGAIQIPMKIYEMGLLTADALYDDYNSPNATAKVNQLHDKLDKGQAYVNSVRDGYKQQLWQDSQIDPVWGEVVAETAVFWPLAATKAGTTFTRAMLTNSSGAALFMGQHEAGEEGSTFGSMLGKAGIGAVFGAGVTIGLSTLKGAQSFLSRKWARESERAYAKDALKLEQRVQRQQVEDHAAEIQAAREAGKPEPAPLKEEEMFSFSLAQISGDNFYLTGLEKGAAGRSLLEKQNRNMTILVKHLEREAGNKSPDAIVSGLSTVMQNTAKAMSKSASRNYERRTEAVFAASGEDLIFDGKRYLEATRQLAREAMNPAGVNGGTISPGFERHLTWLDEVVEPAASRFNTESGLYEVFYKGTPETVVSTTTNGKEAARRVAQIIDDEGGMTAAELEFTIKSHNAVLNEASTSNFYTNASGMQAGLKYINGELLYSMRGSSNAAVRNLNDARLGYKIDMSYIMKFKNSSLGRILGQSDEAVQQTLADPNIVLDRIISLHDASTMGVLRKDLQAIAPDLLGDVQDAIVRRVLLKGKAGSGAHSGATIETNLMQLGTALEGAGKTEVVGRVGMGLLNPGQQDELIRTGKALKHLSSTYISQLEKDAAGVASDTAINIISRSAEFMSRYIVRLLAKGETLEQILIDPKVRESIVTLAELGPGNKIKLLAGSTAAINNTEALNDAIGYLAFAAGEQQGRDERQEKQDKLLDQTAAADRAH